MAKRKKQEAALEIVFLNDVLGDLEAQLGVELVAVAEDDLNDLLHGLELLDRLIAEEPRDPAALVPLEEVALTEDAWALLERTEAEYGIRIIAYHAGADAVLYGEALIADVDALCAAQNAAL